MNRLPACSRAVALLLLSPLASAQVVAEQKLSSLQGDLGIPLENVSRFGSAAAPLGDVDSDGVPDVAVGEPAGTAATTSPGSVWVLMLNADGTVKDRREITDGAGGFGGSLGADSQFGRSLASLGDVDSDGDTDLAVGSPYQVDALTSVKGFVWILRMQPGGTVQSAQRIGTGEGGFTGVTDYQGRFGHAVTAIGDLDGNGVGDLAVGEPMADQNGVDRGAVWILFLDGSDQVIHSQKIGSAIGGFGGGLDDGDLFGAALAGLGDLDGDGLRELAIGAPDDDDGDVNQGAIWIVSLDSTGKVAKKRKISGTTGDFVGELDGVDNFGESLSNVGNLIGGPTVDLLVGAEGDDDGGANHGAVWLLALRTDASVRTHLKISETEGGFGGALSSQSFFGTSCCRVGDLDGDGEPELLVGARGDDDGGDQRGAAWVLFTEEVPTADVLGLGCGLNPPESLLVQGLPVLGATFGIEVDNPLGSQPPGSIPVLVISASHFAAGGSCGVPIPGWHMNPAASFGELLVKEPFLFGPLLGAPWAGAGNPSAFPVSVPHDPALAGVPVFAQGAIFDPFPAAGGIFVGLTRGRALVLGT